jgi:hypothetical protein
LKVLTKYFGGNVERDILEKSWELLADENMLPKKQYPSYEGLNFFSSLDRTGCQGESRQARRLCRLKLHQGNLTKAAISTASIRKNKKKKLVKPKVTPIDPEFLGSGNRGLELVPTLTSPTYHHFMIGVGLRSGENLIRCKIVMIVMPAHLHSENLIIASIAISRFCFTRRRASRS